MAIPIDELIISLRLQAEGVKQGMAVATETIRGGVGSIEKELKKIEDSKKKLAQEIQFKINESGIHTLNQKLKDLELQKKRLSDEIRFKVDSADVLKLKAELSEVSEDIRIVEDDLKIRLSLEDTIAATAELERLKQYKTELEASIKMTVEADTEAAKTKMNELSKEMQNTEREISIHFQTEGINDMRSRLLDMNSSTEAHKQRLQEIQTQYPKLSLAATGALVAITKAVMDGIGAYNQYVSTMNGLESQIKNIGASMADAMSVVKEKTADGLISESDVSASIKNLTTYGMTIEQAAEVIDRLKDSAAYGRQSQYDLGEAVRVTTEGIRMENSVLSDASGIQKTIAKMQEEYAKSLGKTKDYLSDSEKAQAIYNGVMQETEAVIGNAAGYSEELAGSQARLAASNTKLSQSFGREMSPMVRLATEGLTAFSAGLTETIDKSGSLASGFVTATAAGVGFIALKTGFSALGITITSVKTATLGAASAFGVWGVAIAAIGAVIGIIVSEISKQKQAQEELNAKIKEHNDLVTAKTTAENIDAKKAEIVALEEAKQKYMDYMDAYRQIKEDNPDKDIFYWMAESAKISGHEISDIRDELELLGVELSAVSDEAGNFADETNKINAEINKLNVNDFSAKDIFSDMTAEIENTIKSSAKLESAFKTLSSGDNLSADAILELCRLYPQLSKYITETGDVSLKNGQLLKEIGKQDIEMSKERLSAQKAELEGYIATTQTKIDKYNEYAEKISRGPQLFSTEDSGFLSPEELAKEQQALSDYETQLQSVLELLSSMMGIQPFSSGNDPLQEIRGSADETYAKINQLDSAFRTVADGGKLSGDEIRSLTAAFPELNAYLQTTGDVTFQNGELLKRVGVISKQSAIAVLESEREKANAIIEQGRTSIKVYQAQILGAAAFEAASDAATTRWSERLDATRKAMEEAQALISEIDSQIAGLNFGDVFSFSSGGSTKSSSASLSNSANLSNKNDALDSYVKNLNDSYALERKSEAEYLAGLQHAHDTFAKNADERIELTKQIFNQKKKIEDDDFAETKRRIDEEAQYYENAEEYKLQKWKDYLDEKNKTDGGFTSKDTAAAVVSEMVTAEKAGVETRIELSKQELDEKLKNKEIERDAYISALEEMAKADDLTFKQNKALLADVADAYADWFNEEKKILDEEKALGAIGLQQYADMILTKKDLWIQSGKDEEEFNRQHRAAQRAADDEYTKDKLSVIKKAMGEQADYEDYTEILASLEQYISEIERIYGEYPDIVKEKTDEALEYQVTATRKAKDDLLAIYEEEINGAKDKLGNVRQKLKAMNGLQLSDGSIFEYKIEDDIKYFQNFIAENDKVIQHILNMNEEDIKANKKKLDEKYKQNEQYQQEIALLGIEALQEAQKRQKEDTESYKKSLEEKRNAAIEAEKAITDTSISAAQERHKAREAELNAEIESVKAYGAQVTTAAKQRYDIEVSLAQDAADEEVAIYEAKIKEIDDKIKAMNRAEDQEEFTDKVRRLQEQLKFEKDDANRYELQKEIGQLTKENNKKLAKEVLEDKKSELQQEITAIKDRLALEKKALQDQRDFEVRLAEERTQSELDRLEEELNNAKEAHDKETDMLKKSLTARETTIKTFYENKIKEAEKNTIKEKEILDTQLENSVKTMDDESESLNIHLNKRTANLDEFYIFKYSKAAENAESEEKLAASSTNNIISNLMNMIPRFAAAGQAAGAAWREAYEAQIQAAMAAASAAQGEISAMSANNVSLMSEPAQITVYQTIEAPVPSPSDMSRRSALALEDALRYV